MVQSHPDVCRKSKKWRDQCPMSCGICPCYDSKTKFQRTNGGRFLSCYTVQKNDSKCEKDDIFKEKCPLTCNTCPKMKEYGPVCEIDAKVAFPDIEDAPYYGYHSD